MMATKRLWFCRAFNNFQGSDNMLFHRANTDVHLLSHLFIFLSLDIASLKDTARRLGQSTKSTRHDALALLLF